VSFVGRTGGCQQRPTLVYRMLHSESDSLAGASNHMLTTRQLAKRYQVTSRTIQSWRDLGSSHMSGSMRASYVTTPMLSIVRPEIANACDDSD